MTMDLYTLSRHRDKRNDEHSVTTTKILNTVTTCR